MSPQRSSLHIFCVPLFSTLSPAVGHCHRQGLGWLWFWFNSEDKRKEKKKPTPKQHKTKQNTFLFPFQTWHVSSSEKKKTTETKHTHAPHKNKAPQDLFSSVCYRRYRYFTSSSGTQIIHNSVHISSLGPSTWDRKCSEWNLCAYLLLKHCIILQWSRKLVLIVEILLML